MTRRVASNASAVQMSGADRYAAWCARATSATSGASGPVYGVQNCQPSAAGPAALTNSGPARA